MWTNNYDSGNAAFYCKMFFYKNIFLSYQYSLANIVQEGILTIIRNKMESQKK